MPDGNYTSKVILKLKKVCKERGLKPPDVYDMVAAEYGSQQVSLSSIRRVFADGSENSGFRYSSIKPIVTVLLGVIEDESEGESPGEFDPDKAREYFAERNALQEVVRLKAAEEERLRTRLIETEANGKEELARLSFLHDQNIDRLLSTRNEHASAQSKTIEILEKNNSFFLQSIASLQKALDEERESKKRLYDDIRKLHDDVNKLKSKYD